MAEVLEEHFGRDLGLLILGYLLAMLIAAIVLLNFGNVIYG